jgi:hypothetical protein
MVHSVDKMSDEVSLGKRKSLLDQEIAAKDGDQRDEAGDKHDGLCEKASALTCTITKRDKFQARKIVAGAYKHGWPAGSDMQQDAEYVCRENRIRIAYRGAFPYTKKGRQDDNSRLLRWTMSLTERNMKSLYLRTWGWNEKNKMRELRLGTMHVET